MSDTTIFTVGETHNFCVGDRIHSSEVTGELTITAVDREAGMYTVSATRILKQIYSEDAVQKLVFSESSIISAQEWGRMPGALHTVGAATIAVVTTAAALEWLRHRKTQVAAAEGSEEAYRSLLSEFLIWLRRWLEVCGWERKA